MQDQNKMFFIVLAFAFGLLYLGWNLFSPKYDDITAEKMVKEAYFKVAHAYYVPDMINFPVRKEKNHYYFEGDVNSIAYGKNAKEHYKCQLRIKKNPFKVIVSVNVYVNNFFVGQYNVDLKNNIIS